MRSRATLTRSSRIYARHSARCGDTRLAVMAAIMVADELSEGRRRIRALEQEIEGLQETRLPRRSHRGGGAHGRAEHRTRRRADRASRARAERRPWRRRNGAGLTGLAARAERVYIDRAALRRASEANSPGP